MPSPSPLPDSYKALGHRYGVRLKKGDVVYDQGAATGHFYVVTSGRVVFEIVDAGGAPAVVNEAVAGDCFGEVSAFSGRPTSASATATESTVLISIPVSEAPDAFKLSPELAVALVTQLAGQGMSRRHQEPRDPDDVAAEPVSDSSQLEPRARAARPTQVNLVRLDLLLNEEWFFKDDIVCPVSGAHFEYLRVRTGAVKPASRDSDFRIAYRTVDPTHYSVVVCPECSYAAYHDDFKELSDTERRDLLATQADRDMQERPNLCEERSLDDAAVALDLALSCYEARRANDRRRAGLLHRRARLERERGDTRAEISLLGDACESYRLAYERDQNMTDTEALRAAYLIGDLYFRVGKLELAARWLSTCVEMPEAKVQTGISRMARDRLHDARKLVFRRSGNAA